MVSQQGEGYVTGNNAKKGAGDELYMKKGRYTTCDNHEHPHFYMQMTYAKVRPKKNVVTGPAYLVVEDVPLPLAVPFFFFPFSSSYQSGFLMPTYMDDSSRGFGLVDGGYYFAISDQMDLKLRGDIFTKGSWALRAESNYVKRYKFSGLFQMDYQVTKTGDKGLSDYLVAKDFKIVWSHRQDPKANPNSTFSASVNFSTSSYERTNINNMYNSQLMSQNTKTSSVSYSRNFFDNLLSISATANIAQTMRDSSISVTLPDLNISLSTVYPFRRKNRVGDEKWYEKINLRYTGRLTNSIQTKDNLLFKSSLTKDWENTSTSRPRSNTTSGGTRERCASRGIKTCKRPLRTPPTVSTASTTIEPVSASTRRFMACTSRCSSPRRRYRFATSSRPPSASVGRPTSVPTASATTTPTCRRTNTACPWTPCATPTTPTSPSAFPAKANRVWSPSTSPTTWR